MLSLILFYLFVQKCASEGNSKFFCSNTDLHPQTFVDIEQLTGQWFGIEIINHKVDARHEIVYEDGCPILTFIEEKEPMRMPPEPIFEYDQPPEQVFTSSSSNQRYQDKRYKVYTTQRTTTMRSYVESQNIIRAMFDNEAYRRSFMEHMRRLRVTWDENGSVYEYFVRYNVTKAGFWIASGPQNGSSLEPKFNSFAGAIHVLKAVGNHMVLVFCHRLPEPQLYSVLLSRVQNLSQVEIHGVHNLLNRRGLNTNSIRKVCMEHALLDSNDAIINQSTTTTLLLLGVSFVVAAALRRN